MRMAAAHVLGLQHLLKLLCRRLCLLKNQMSTSNEQVHPVHYIGCYCRLGCLVEHCPPAICLLAGQWLTGRLTGRLTGVGRSSVGSTLTMFHELHWSCTLQTVQRLSAWPPLLNWPNLDMTLVWTAILAQIIRVAHVWTIFRHFLNIGLFWYNEFQKYLL